MPGCDSQIEMRNRHKDYSSFQEGAKRFQTAMKGVPDRVPIYAQMHEFVMRELDVSGKEFYNSPELLAAGTLEILEKYGFDIPFLDFDVYNIEAEALGQKVIYSDNGMPDVDRSRPLIQDRNDLKKIETPVFDSDGRFPRIIEMYSIFQKLTGVAPTLEFCAPYSWRRGEFSRPESRKRGRREDKVLCRGWRKEWPVCPVSLQPGCHHSPGECQGCHRCHTSAWQLLVSS